MFDLAWSEIMLIGAVALVVIGPKELPGAIRTVSQFIRKAREMAWEMRGHVDEMVREANLDEVRNQINEIRNSDIKGEVTKAVDPDGSLRRAMTEAGESIQEAAQAMDDPDRHPATTAADAEGVAEPETTSADAAAESAGEAEAPDELAAEDRSVDREPLEAPAAAPAPVAEPEPAAAAVATAALPEAEDRPPPPEPPSAPPPAATVTTPRPPAPAYEPPAFVPPGTRRN